MFLEHQRIEYFWYLHDIIPIYDERKGKKKKTKLTESNAKEPTITFTTERESHNFINSLDLSINREEKEYKYAI